MALKYFLKQIHLGNLFISSKIFKKILNKTTTNINCYIFLFLFPGRYNLRWRGPTTTFHPDGRRLHFQMDQSKYTALLQYQIF